MKSLLATLQDRVAALLGLSPNRRTPIVHGMLHRPQGDSAGYWLQLLISATLATLGLALDSTAVVIGAMLIAPLMRPIVELSMGLATGSTPLVFRTGFRAIGSIAVVVLASAGFARLLPFHELTSELLARTAPSLLDLFVAAACALAGAYAVVITTSDVATTAAGTSIGISLVPPLCTAGYGIAVGDWDVAVGAALLFTANVTGIITVAGALFVLVGFGQVDIHAEERTLDEDANIAAATRIGRTMSAKGRTRLGGLVRVVVPLTLLAGVAFPLQRAVDEMSQRSTVRQRIAGVLQRSNGDRIVQYHLDQASRPTTLRVVMVGDPARAKVLENKLRAELQILGASSAAVSVWAVSDAMSVSALSARLADVPSLLAPAEREPPLALDARIRALWPERAGSSPLSIWTAHGDLPRVRITHLGNPLGPAALELLAEAAADGDAIPVVEEVALFEVTAPPVNSTTWLAEALALVERAADHSAVQLCVTIPPRPAKRGAQAAAWDIVRATLDEQARERSQMVLAEGDMWRITPMTSPCQHRAL